jgi:hypothetical protein
MKCTLIAIGLLVTASQVSPAFGRGGVIHLIHAPSSSGQEVITLQRAIKRLSRPSWARRTRCLPESGSARFKRSAFIS